MWGIEMVEKMKCVNPLKHNPQFEGKHHCKACEAQRILTELTGEEE
tara:strand:- start:221 stop:358 length:138 start_codon:yes stop_codon:yes gene_type:complete